MNGEAGQMARLPSVLPRQNARNPHKTAPYPIGMD